MLKLGHFRNLIRNVWKVVKCCARGGWKIPVGPIVRKLVFGRVNDERNDLHTIKEDTLTGLVTSCIGNSF
jgi:hypothetical protein